MSNKHFFSFVCLNAIVVLSMINLNYVTCKSSDHHNEYLHEWAVQVRDAEEADLIALETGFNNEGPVSIFAKYKCD